MYAAAPRASSASSNTLRHQPLAGPIGIGHTRWATHGPPNETNAHPHATDVLAVVHNGNIENFRELRSELEAEAASFESETDTEVVAHLVTRAIRAGAVASERLANGYRAYDREAVGVLHFINRAKALGFSLEEVREILTLRRGGTEPFECVTAMIERNLVAIDERIAELSRLRRQLRALTKNPTRERPAEAICPILESDARSWRGPRGGDSSG